MFFLENADDAAQREENTLYFWYCSTTCLHLSAGCVCMFTAEGSLELKCMWTKRKSLSTLPVPCPFN